MISTNQDKCYECICYRARRCELYYVCTDTGLCTICSFVFAKNFLKKRVAFDRGLLVRGQLARGGGGGLMSGGLVSTGSICPGAIVRGAFVPEAVGRIPTRHDNVAHVLLDCQLC